jgi:serine/threonine-protein kinase RsbW
MTKRPDSSVPKAAQRGSLDVTNDPRAIDDAQNRVVAAAEHAGYPKASVFALKLALHEALMNAFRHGHKHLPASVPVHFSFAVSPKQIDLTIEDQGPGFNPSEVPDPTLDENLERGSGRGLLLIKAYMSKVEFEGRGNRLRMVYARPQAS